MKKYRFAPILLVLALFGTLFVLSLASQPSAEAQGGNLLTNPSFEGAYSSFIPQTADQNEACPIGECTTAQMPNGWLPWWVNQTDDDEPWFNRMPEYKPVCPFEPCPYPERLKDGAQALQYFTFHSTHTAGVWQRVSVPANSNLTFSIWGQAWSSASDASYSDFPTTVNMRIGIDPTGGTNPFSGNIVWSGFSNPYDQYVPFEVTATAQGETVTVFTWSQPQEARKHNDIYWDGASLSVGGAGSPAPAAAAGGNTGGAAAPAAPPRPVGPTPTPNAEGVIQVEVLPGDSLWAIAARAGISLDEVLEYNDLARNDFVNAGDLLVIGYGEPGAGGDAAAEEPAADEAATEDTAAEDTAAVEETAAEDSAAVEEPAAEEPAAEEATADQATTQEVAQAQPQGGGSEETPTGGTMCLRAFDDANANGVYDAGETLKSAVAMTIANGQNVVSNYVTDGVSEPYCIEGLDPGSYRVSRSFAPNEETTNAADWAVSLTDGARVDIDFGSQIVAAAEPTAATEVAAAGGETAAETTNAVSAAGDETGTDWMTWIVSGIVGLAVLLLAGVGLIVFSARRAN